MARNALQEAADRLGFLAYLTVMGGGMPDLRLYRAALREHEAPRAAEETRALVPYDPLARTVRYVPLPEHQLTPTEAVAA